MKIIRLADKDIDRWFNQIEPIMEKCKKENFPDSCINWGGYCTQKLNELKQYLIDNKAVVFAAVDDNRLAGWVWSHPIDRFGCERMHIADIEIAERYQKQGIGRNLLETVKQFAIANNFDGIDLVVSTCNQNAMDFYRHLGFRDERIQMLLVVNN